MPAAGAQYPLTWRRLLDLLLYRLEHLAYGRGLGQLHPVPA